MQLIKQSDINRTKWDELVRNSLSSTIYNQSVFLDTLSENWMLLTNDDYSVGLPIPFTVRFGIKGIYTPNFCREFSFIGFEHLMDKQVKECVELLKKQFNYCSLNLVENYFYGEFSTKVFQVLSTPPSLNSQAKRSVKRFEKTNFIVQKTELSSILSIVSKELRAKVQSLRKIDVRRFEQVIHALPPNKLYVLGVKNENLWLGGLIFIQSTNKLHYLKGGACEEAKSEGAMFFMMNEMIKFASENKLELDFGGSNVKGVQRFNKSFGAIDQEYIEWHWNHSPKWFTLLQQARNRFKKI